MMIVNRGYLNEAFELLESDRFPYLEEAGQETTSTGNITDNYYEIYKFPSTGQRWIVRHAYYNSSGNEFVSVDRLFDYPETQV